MAAPDRYRVFTARDNIINLNEVLQYIATMPGHSALVSVTWQSPRSDGQGLNLPAGYTIIAEFDVDATRN